MKNSISIGLEPDSFMISKITHEGDSSTAFYEIRPMAHNCKQVAFQVTGEKQLIKDLISVYQLVIERRLEVESNTQDNQSNQIIIPNLRLISKVCSKYEMNGGIHYQVEFHSVRGMLILPIVLPDFIVAKYGALPLCKFKENQLFFTESPRTQA